MGRQYVVPNVATPGSSFRYWPNQFSKWHLPAMCHPHLNLHRLNLHRLSAGQIPDGPFQSQAQAPVHCESTVVDALYPAPHHRVEVCWLAQFLFRQSLMAVETGTIGDGKLSKWVPRTAW